MTIFECILLAGAAEKGTLDPPKANASLLVHVFGSLEPYIDSTFRWSSRG